MAMTRKEKINQILKETLPCPCCEGRIRLYTNPIKEVIVFAKCSVCKEEYPLPNVQLKTLRSNPIMISLPMIRNAVKEWNKLHDEFLQDMEGER